VENCGGEGGGCPAPEAVEVNARINETAAIRGRTEPLMSLQFALFGPIGLPEMLIILVIIMLIFGASRLPEIGKGIGQGIKNFKSSVKDVDETKQST
jgi:sec-independent protein translocase protein TatA